MIEIIEDFYDKGVFVLYLMIIECKVRGSWKVFFNVYFFFRNNLDLELCFYIYIN